jgi:hypothetical protein
MDMVILQVSNPILNSLEELALSVLDIIKPNPPGGLLIVIGFVLVIAAQINVKLFNFGYEHRRNGIIITLLGVILFVAGIIMLTQSHYRVPSVFDANSNIETAYEYGLGKEYYSSSKEMESYYESVIRRFEDSKGFDEEKFKYYKAKVAYEYASFLFENEDYAKAAQYFQEAFLLYKSSRESFENRSPLDQMKAKSDFRFDKTKAYEALYLSALSNKTRAMRFREEVERDEFLKKSKEQIENILNEESIVDSSFRSRVWFSRGEIQEAMRDEKYRESYIFSYLSDKNNQEAIEKLSQLGFFDADGQLVVSGEEIEKMISSSEVPFLLSVGGEDEQISSSNDSQDNDIEFNPFSSAVFPIITCGDSKPVDPFAYPWKLNPVYALYPEEDLLKIKVTYCTDAFFSSREGKIQVASFSNSEKGHYFDEFLKNELGEELVETGATHVYCTIDSKVPIILEPGQAVEEVCSGQGR